MVDFNNIIPDDMMKKAEKAAQFTNWAKEADGAAGGSKDGVYLNSAFEREYVKRKAIEAGWSSEEIAEAFKSTASIMGGEFSKSDARQIKTETTKSQKEAQTVMINDLLAPQKDSFASNGDWSQVSNNIFSGLNNAGFRGNQYYNKLANSVKDIATKMAENKYDSKHDVSELYDKVKEQLKLDKNDELYDFKLKVVRTFVDFAEAHQKKKEEARLSDRYNDLYTPLDKERAFKKMMDADPKLKKDYELVMSNNGTFEEFAQLKQKDKRIIPEYIALTTAMSREDALKNIEKDKRFQDSYYNGLIKELKAKTKESDDTKDDAVDVTPTVQAVEVKGASDTQQAVPTYANEKAAALSSEPDEVGVAEGTARLKAEAAALQGTAETTTAAAEPETTAKSKETSVVQKAAETTKPEEKGVKTESKSVRRDKKAQQERITTQMIQAETTAFQQEADKTGKPDFKIFVNNILEKLFSEESVKNMGDSNVYYPLLVREMESVADAMNKHNSYNSRKDVMKLYDQVKSELNLKKDDEFKEFKLDVLEQFVKEAEKHQVQKEETLLINGYNGLRKSGKSRKEAIKDIQNNIRFKGSYYETYAGRTVHEQVHKEQGTIRKGLISKNLIDGTVQGEADARFEQAVNNQRIKKVSHVTNQENGTEIDASKLDMTTSRKVEKGAVAEIKSEEGEMDKYMKKAKRGHLSFSQKVKGERSKIKGLRQTVSIENNVYINKHKQFTKDEFYKELNNDALFQALCGIGVPRNLLKDHPAPLQLNKDEKGDIVRDKDGNETYNLTNLANVIALRVGSDGIANSSTGELIPYSEVENTIITIAANLGIPNIQKHDIKNLIEMCGFKVEGKNMVRVFYDTLVGTAMDSLTGLAAALGVNPKYAVSAFASASVVGKATPVIKSANVVGYNGGPITVPFNYSKSFLDQVRQGGVNFTLDVGIEGLGKLKFDEDDFWMNYDGNPDDVNIKFDPNNPTSLQIVIQTEETLVNLIRNVNEKLTKLIDKLEDLGIDWSQFEMDIDADVDMSNVKAKIDELRAEVDDKTDIKSAILKSMIVNLVLNFVEALLKERNTDTPVTVTQFDTPYIEEYISRLNVNTDPKVAQGLALLAGLFIERDAEGKEVVETNENGVKHYKWNAEAYKKFLDTRVAGSSSMPNQYETFNTLSRIGDIKNEMSKVKIKPKEEPAPVEPEQTPPVQPEKPVDNTSKTKTIYNASEITNIDKFLNARAYQWQDIVNIYPELNNYSYDEKVRFIKVMQGFKNVNFTFDQIMEIVNTTRPGKKVTPEEKEAIKKLPFITEQNYDVEMFAAHVNIPGSVGDDSGNLIALHEIKDEKGNVRCKRNDNIGKTPYQGPKDTGSKGNTPDKSTTYYHMDDQGNIGIDANQTAQSEWNATQNATNVESVKGGRRGLEEKQKQLKKP